MSASRAGRRGARPCLQEASSQESGGLLAEDRVGGVRTGPVLIRGKGGGEAMWALCQRRA